MLWYSVQWKSLIDIHNQTSLGCVDEVSLFLLPDFVGDSSMGACYPFPLQAMFIGPHEEPLPSCTWNLSSCCHITFYLIDYTFSIIQIHSSISIFGYTHSIIQIHSTTAIWNYGHSILCIHSNLHGCSAKNSSVWMSIHMKMHIMHVNAHNVLTIGYAAQHIY